MTTNQDTSAERDLVAHMRSFEADHEPDGWPAVRMREISALCDEIERLRAALASRDEAAQQPQGQAVSDEEIVELFDKHISHDEETGFIFGVKEFARAILALRDGPSVKESLTVEQRVPLSEDWATIAGLESAVGHLSTLVDQQRALLAESEDVFGRDGHGGRYEDGECGLIDRIRAHLEMTAPPPNGTTAKEQGNGN